jgi:hypothetical protein
VWVPKAYEGAYGTNGFYITGEDSAALGTDYSGNGNDFTSSGLTSDDQVTDSPTDNFCTMSPLDKRGSIGFSDGNLTLIEGGAGDGSRGTFSRTSGKWYFEFLYSATGSSDGSAIVGISLDDITCPSSTSIATVTGGVFVYRDDGYIITGGVGTGGFTNFGHNAVVQVAVDRDNDLLWFGVNGTWEASGDPAAGTGEQFDISGYTGRGFAPYAGFQSSSGTQYWLGNFGQLGFAYAPPTGFVALSTANLPAPTIKDGSKYFQTSLWSGNSSTQEINQAGNSTFQPDLVWLKSRSTTYNNQLQDAIRGVGNVLFSNLTNAEGSYPSTITSLDADGFTLGSDAGANQSGETYVGWQWLAGNGTASNTDGTITSTVSVNQTAGFSVVTYTGTGSAATVGHGLSTTPEMIIVKNRSASWGWFVYNSHLTSPTTGRLQLNLTNAEIAGGTPGPWNNTAPTSDVFSIGDSSFPEVNGSGNSIVAYCFAEVEGFSKFGRYTGNTSTDGPFVYCGFKPTFILIKMFSTPGNWWIWDVKRNTYNAMNSIIYPDLANAEYSDATTFLVDALSNGFKMRTSNATVNGSGNTYIFMAFAEHPFGGSGVAPATAR